MHGDAVTVELMVLHGFEAVDIAGGGNLVDERHGSGGQGGDESIVSAEAGEL